MTEKLSSNKFSEKAELFEDAGRLGNPRTNDQECSYNDIVLEVRSDSANVTIHDTCGLPRTHGGLGIE